MPQIQRSLQISWLKVLMATLFGYAVLGRGFAYLFIGEAVLLLGILIYLRSQRLLLVLSDPVLALWGAFACWGIYRTIPYLAKYHFDAVRDDVLWGYGVFALLITAFVNESRIISSALNCYRRFLRWYLPILPLVVIVSFAFKGMPTIPWSDHVGIISLKRDDAAVHLAGAALFYLLFPDKQYGLAKQGPSVYRMLGLVGWSITALIILVMNRSGLLAIIIPIGVVSSLRFSTVGWRAATLAVVGATSLGLVLAGGLIPVHLTKTRALTLDQIVVNVSSIVGASHSDRSEEGTKQWRLIWWRHIVDYTVFGSYFWTGKGFGVNLALEDGPPGITKEESSLRSPHNGSMTVLARMGVPGMLLWVTLNLTFVYRLLKHYRLATQNRLRFWSALNLWILSYWLAAFLSLSFDVYLEGPPGGIWFWSIIGLGVAATRTQAHEARLARLEGPGNVAHSLRPHYSAAPA